MLSESQIVTADSWTTVAVAVPRYNGFEHTNSDGRNLAFVRFKIGVVTGEHNF
jgi:hypothetical protein